jgi:hypothetical protein
MIQMSQTKMVAQMTVCLDSWEPPMLWCWWMNAMTRRTQP